MKFLLSIAILLVVFIGCNETKSKKNEKIESKLENIEILIKSPSERCSYSITLKNNGELFSESFSFDTINQKSSKNQNETLIEEKVDIEKLNDIIKLLDNGEPLIGRIKNDGWNYKIFLNEEVKVDVYDENDSDILLELLMLSELHSKNSIDYKCF